MASKLVLCFTVICLFGIASSALTLPLFGGNLLQQQLQLVQNLLRQSVTTTARASTTSATGTQAPAAPLLSSALVNAIQNLLSQILTRLANLEAQLAGNDQTLGAVAA